MNLPVCAQCGACDWSRAADLIGAAFMRLSPGDKSVYVDLASPNLTATARDFGQPFCTGCGAQPAESPASNPRELKNAFRWHQDTNQWRVREPDQPPEWLEGHRIDPGAWPAAYDRYQQDIYPRYHRDRD